MKSIDFYIPVISDAAIFACRGTNVRCDLNLPSDLWNVEIGPGQIKKQLCNFRVYYHRSFFYCIVFVLTVMFQTDVKASMGTMTVKGIEAEIVSISESVKLSRTTLKTSAIQERNITINDVSGTLMVTGFSNILTSTALNSSHNGVILVSGNTTLSLPSASSNIGIQFTIEPTHKLKL